MPGGAATGQTILYIVCLTIDVLKTKIKTENHSNVLIMENNKNKKIRKLVLYTFALILMCNSSGIPNKSDVCKHNLDNVIILSCHAAINYMYNL